MLPSNKILWAQATFSTIGQLGQLQNLALEQEARSSFHTLHSQKYTFLFSTKNSIIFQYWNLCFKIIVKNKAIYLHDKNKRIGLKDSEDNTAENNTIDQPHFKV